MPADRPALPAVAECLPIVNSMMSVPGRQKVKHSIVEALNASRHRSLPASLGDCDPMHNSEVGPWGSAPRKTSGNGAGGFGAVRL
jgi:hypothetical protein